MADVFSMERKHGVVGAMWRLNFSVLVLGHMVGGVSGSACVHLRWHRLVYDSHVLHSHKVDRISEAYCLILIHDASKTHNLDSITSTALSTSQARDL